MQARNGAVCMGMGFSERHLLMTSPEETAHAARQLGSRLTCGDVVLLEGPVGAGKTHFARHLIQSLLTDPEDIPSPTFTLVQTYDTRAGPLWHSDLYRIGSTLEIEELGLIEAFETAICLVEWPDRLGELTPGNALTIRLAHMEDEDTRQMHVIWSDPKWDAKTNQWAQP